MGIVEAYSEDLAVEALQEKGLIIINLSPVNKNVLGVDVMSVFNQPNSRDVIIFTRQLATIISASIPLIEGLQTIASQTEKKAFGEIVSEVVEAIRGGSSLSQALVVYPRLFSGFFLSIIRSGETSGRLDQSLLYLADHLEKNQVMSAKIRGALAYPIFILCALVGVSLIMVTTILPKLLDIIRESGVAPEDIPLITRVLMSITGVVNDYLVWLVVLPVILIIFLVRYIKTEAGHYRLDRFKIDVPRLGTIARNVYIARMAEALSSLTKADVPILDSLRITADMINNYIYRDILLEAQKAVRSGGSISGVLAAYPEFPKLVSSMLAVGEKTGKTDLMLDSIFKFYSFDADQDIQNLSGLIEPVLILILGAGVGLLVAGILLPIFSLVGAS